MRLLKELLLPAILSIVFIFLTGWIAFGDIISGPVFSFCFYFHMLPFGMAFAGGGGTFTSLIYYLILWLVLTILFLGIKRMFNLLKRTPKSTDIN